MGFSAAMKPRGKVLIAAVVGVLGMKEHVSMRDQGRASCKTPGTKASFQDLRGAVVKVSLTDVFKAASTHTDVIDHTVKHATVTSAETLPESEVQFGETVAQNRGARWRAFVDPVGLDLYLFLT